MTTGPWGPFFPGCWPARGPQTRAVEKRGGGTRKSEGEQTDRGEEEEHGLMGEKTVHGVGTFFALSFKGGPRRGGGGVEKRSGHPQTPREGPGATVKPQGMGNQIGLGAGGRSSRQGAPQKRCKRFGNKVRSCIKQETGWRKAGSRGFGDCGFCGPGINKLVEAETCRPGGGIRG